MSDKITEKELLARIMLNAAFPYNSGKSIALMKIFGSASEAVKAKPEDLFSIAGFPLDLAEKTAKFLKEFPAEKELSDAEKKGIRIIVQEDDEYPEKLSFIYDPPIVLYVKGCCSSFCRESAAIVGTRNPSPYGLKMTADFAAGLALSGVSVVSGLARGIDSAAHKAALAHGGITWAVLGTGLSNTYPYENAGLADEIAGAGGALISEYPLSQTARQISFPRRNRIISGLSNAIAVIEGTFQSGSLITARYALEQGRDVLALPGRVDSKYAQGPNHLIKNGAYLCESSDDIISCLNDDFRKKAYKEKKEKIKINASIESLATESRTIYEIISKDDCGLTLDEIVFRSGQSIPQVSSSIFELETSGLICQRGGRYVLR